MKRAGKKKKTKRKGSGLPDHTKTKILIETKKAERGIRKDAVDTTQMIMLAAIAQTFKPTAEQLDQLAKNVVRYCEFNQEDLLSLEECRQIFNKYSEAKLEVKK